MVGIIPTIFRRGGFGKILLWSVEPFCRRANSPYLSSISLILVNPDSRPIWQDRDYSSTDTPQILLYEFVMKGISFGAILPKPDVR